MSGDARSTDRAIAYDLDDFRALAELNARGRQGLSRRIVLGLCVIALLLFVVVVAIGQVDLFLHDTAALAALAVALLLPAMLSHSGQALTMRINARQSGLLANHSFAIAPEGFSSSSIKGDTRIKWSAIRDVVLHRDRLFVFIGPKTAFIVLLRAFEERSQFDLFTKATGGYWKKSTRPLP